MQTSHTVIWKGEPNAIVHLSLSNSSPIPLLADGRGAPVWRPARDEREKRGTRPADSVCQHQEGEGEQETQQNEEEGTYPPDGGKNAENFVFACLWFHKIQITAWLHRINKIRPGA